MGRIVFYFDMDGVLNVFDEIAPRSVVLEPGGHYLANRPPDRRAIAMMEELSGCCDTMVLTRLFGFIPASLKAEQEKDKKAWCRRWLPGLDIRNNFVCTDGDKEDVLAGVPLEERKYRILIDDDPDVLAGWEKAGGTGIQYRQEGRTVPRHPNRVIDWKDEDPCAAIVAIVADLDPGRH